MKPFTVELDTVVVPPTPAFEPNPNASAPVPNYPIDPGTGTPVSRITGGSCPENNIGDLTTPPATLVTNPGQNREE